jgi:1-deoxy-D-xylulose-5-phosphate reductoisomerase
MGRKITIDSATMVNKGLEVMEARWLFNVGYDDITVVVHPQSILHSAVEYVDGAVIGQMGMPDMKLPIQYALFYPGRELMEGNKLDLFEISRLDFIKPDPEVFEGLGLAFKAGRKAGNLPTVFNAANEMAVALFLDKKISFTGITDIIKDCMANIEFKDAPSLEEILETESTTYDFIKSKYIK